MANRLRVINNPETISCQVQGTIADLGDRFGSKGIDDSPDPEERFSSQEVLQAIQTEEDGDAWLFVELQKGRFVFDHAAGRWYEWNGQLWQEDTTRKVVAAVEAVIETYANEALKQAGLWTEAEKGDQKEEAKNHAKTQKAINKRIRELHKISRKINILNLASVDWSQTGRESLSLAGHEWDADPWLLGCRNGVVNLRTGDLRPGRPEDYIKVAAPTEWQELCCPAPIWENFLNEIFNGDTDLISYVQRLLGMALIGLSVEHVFFILWGRGRNGKSTLLETLGHVLGDIAGPIEAEMLLDQGRNRRSGGPTSDIMALRGKRIVWASETGEGRRLDPGKLKWLTGGDSLTGREMYGKRQVSFRPTHTSLLLTNHRPQAPADDFAFWQRIHLIPFTQAFVDNPSACHEHRVDHALAERLKAEASGILAWLVNGALEYQRDGLSPPPVVLEATRNYQQEEDDVGRFIEERCILRDGAEIRAGDLYGAYQDWCEDNRQPSISNRKFSERILQIAERDDNRRHRYYLGIDLAAAHEPGD